MSHSDDSTQLRAFGFGGRQGLGLRPAMIVVDFSFGFTDPASPLACDCDSALVQTARLLDIARAKELPVFFTTVQYDEAGRRQAATFIAKAPALATLTPDSRWVEIDDRIAPAPGEPVLEKLFASSFFGTELAALLAERNRDSVIIVGASTSGCVRATAVDAMQHGLRAVVVADAVADRVSGAHAASLTDIDAKYGDVLTTDELVAALTADD